MVIFCKNDGNVSSFPSSIPYGTSLREITIIVPRIVATIVLKLAPPNGEYLPPLVCEPSFNDDGVVVFTPLLNKSISSIVGRARYQIDAITQDNEVIAFETGTFNITKGVPVAFPDDSEELKEYTIEELNALLANANRLHRNIETIQDFIDIGTELETVQKTLVGAINELHGRVDNVEIADEVLENYEFISTDKIDEICGEKYEIATTEEVTF